MRVRIGVLLPTALLVMSWVMTAAQDDGNGFQLPVQLIGFPVIIMAVRLSNFMKKLAYAVSPRTYARRVRRGLPALGSLTEAAPDPATVEKLLLGEFGTRVCVYERVCSEYAQKALDAPDHNNLLDWNQVFSRYKSSADTDKQNYLLSVFLGDMVKSPALCHGLAKRGRSCPQELGVSHEHPRPPVRGKPHTTHQNQNQNQNHRQAQHPAHRRPQNHRQAGLATPHRQEHHEAILRQENRPAQQSRRPLPHERRQLLGLSTRVSSRRVSTHTEAPHH